MHYADIKKIDIANGEGVRVSLFVSGCRHHCKGCFNEIAWNFKYGKEFTQDTVDEIIRFKPRLCRGTKFTWWGTTRTRKPRSIS